MPVEAVSIHHARQICRRLVTTINSPSTVIGGLIKSGKARSDLDLHLKARNIDCTESIGYTAVTLLQACAIERNLERGQQLHAEILKTDQLEGDHFIGTALLGVYAKCGSLEKALEVFSELPIQDVVSWTTLIAGYAEHGHGKRALKCLEQMQIAGTLPDAVTYVCGLKACGSIGITEKIRELHADIERRGLLSSNLFIGSVLVDVYAKCGLLIEAQQVFDKLRIHDAVSWNALISGYIQKGQNRAALDIFQQMHARDVLPDGVTFVHVLKACSNLRTKLKGQEIHVEVVRRGLVEGHALVGSALVDMYMKCGSLMQAQEVFDKLTFKDSISWNIMIVGYVEHGCDRKALECFEKMLSEGLYPDSVTYVSVLRSCGSSRATEQGQVVHAEIIKNGLLEGNLMIANSLIDMYMNFAFLPKARQVFDDLPVRDVVTWNILITGYFNHGHYEQALNCYVLLHKDDVHPDLTTFICCLRICANLEALDKGQEFHSELGRLGLDMTDVSIASTLIDMYAKCGFLAKSEEVFNSYPDRDVVMWNALITGYAEHDCSDVALVRFDQMQLAGCSPSHVTVISILKACGKLGAVQRGQEMHAEAIAKGLFDKDLIVGNALIDMYVKVGSLTMAQQVFDKLPVGVQNISSWNALISGYALLGGSDEVFMLFVKMLEVGVKPDLITLAILLSACGRSSLIEKCRDYVEAMREGFGIVPMFEFYICMVEGSSQVGELERAVGIIKRMPHRPNFLVWQQVLSGCKKWGNIEIGEKAFEEILSNEEAFVT